MTASRSETQTFRVLAVLTLAGAIATVGLAGYWFYQERSSSQFLRETAERQAEVSHLCQRDKTASACEYAATLNQLVKESREESGRAREAALSALQALLLVPGVYALFLLVRFALTARLRPLWPWRLER